MLTFVAFYYNKNFTVKDCDSVKNIKQLFI